MDSVKHSPLPPEQTHMADNHLGSAYSLHPYPTKAPVNHALQDYQTQLLLLERQNKERLLMARGIQQESSTLNQAQTTQAECSSAGKHQLQHSHTQLDRLEQENRKRLLIRLDEQNRKRLQAARDHHQGNKATSSMPSTNVEKPAPRLEHDKYCPRLLVLQKQYDMSMQQAKEHERKLGDTPNQVSPSKSPEPQRPVLSHLEKQVLPDEITHHQATLEGQASSKDSSNHIKDLPLGPVTPGSATVPDYTSLRSPHDMNVFVECSTLQSCAVQTQPLKDLGNLSQLERARNTLPIDQGRPNAKEPLKETIISPGSPQAPNTEGRPQDMNMRSPHDMNAGPIQCTLSICAKSAEIKSSTHEESLAANLRSPHDMNALPDEISPQSIPETGSRKHQAQDANLAIRAQIQRHQLYNQQLFEAYRQKQLHQAMQVREHHAPGFAPASFEYKGPEITAPARPREDVAATTCHLEYVPVEHPHSPQQSNPAVLDTFKGEITATVPQLKQFGSKRRPRRGQFPAMSPPRNTPICRIRSRATTASTRPLSGTRLPPQHMQEPDDMRVNRANISCHEGDSLAIRLHIKE